jgi:hypothetical protein
MASERRVLDSFTYKVQDKDASLFATRYFRLLSIAHCPLQSTSTSDVPRTITRQRASASPRLFAAVTWPRRQVVPTLELAHVDGYSLPPPPPPDSQVFADPPSPKSSRLLLPREPSGSFSNPPRCASLSRSDSGSSPRVAATNITALGGFFPVLIAFAVSVAACEIHPVREPHLPW